MKESEILRLDNIKLDGANEIKIQLGDNDGDIFSNKNVRLIIFLGEEPEDIIDFKGKEEELIGRADIGVIYTSTR